MAALNFYETSDHLSRTLVLLHPGGMLHNVWLPFIRVWSPHYHIIAPDLYGAAAATFTTYQLAQDVISLLRQKSGEPAALIGSSLGANVALQIAVSAPDAVKCLVLDSAQAGGEPDAKTQTILRLMKSILRVVPRSFYVWAIMQSFKSYGEADRRAVQQDVRQLGASGFIQAIEATNEHNVLASLDKISVPVLLTNGKNDPVLSASKILAERLPNADSFVWSDGGHSAFMSHQDSFAQRVLAFLDAHWDDKTPHTA